MYILEATKISHFCFLFFFVGRGGRPWWENSIIIQGFLKFNMKIKETVLCAQKMYDLTNYHHFMLKNVCLSGPTRDFPRADFGLNTGPFPIQK